MDLLHGKCLICGDADVFLWDQKGASPQAACVAYLLRFKVNPAREAWLYQNKAALNSLKKGISEASNGELKNLGSFATYAENHTPGAWRIFWWDGPGKQVLTILAITPHP